MSVRLKLVVIIVFVALVPLGVLSYTTLGLHTRALDKQLAALHLKSAQYGGKVIDSYLEGMRSRFGMLVSNIEWLDLSAEEQEGALWLVYGQHPSVLAVTRVNEKGGAFGPQVYVDVSTHAQVRDHPTVTPEILARFARSIPPLVMDSDDSAVGKTFTLEDGGLALSLAFPVRSVAGAGGGVAVAISLRGVCEELASARPAQTELLLLDSKGVSLCPSATAAVGRRVPAGLRATLGRAGESTRYVDARGRDMLVTRSAAFGSWQVAVQQPAQIALASSVRIRKQSLVWISAAVLAALTAGFVLARGINRPIEKLVRGAAELAKGHFDYRLDPEGDDEFARLSIAFNHMCAEIDKRDTEIRQWNEELQRRVDQRTAELKEVHNALLESRKIAAMASLGAGVAHEINNPLTGVIGITQILKARANNREDGEKESELLAKVEHEALRIRDIVQKVLALSQEHQAGGFLLVKVSALIAHVLDSLRDTLERGHIKVANELTAGADTVFGHREQLENALTQIVNNAVKAMQGDERRLSIALESIDDELLKIRVSDTGKGIAPEHMDKVVEPFFTTKDDWGGEGLGLTTAYRIVEAHKGTLKISSVVGKGTTVVITLPIARQGAHLV